MKKSGKIIIVISCLLIALSIVLIVLRNIREEKEKYITNASVEEITKYNTIMNENYFRYLGDTVDGEFVDYIGSALQILYSEVNVLDRALDEEKYNIGVDFKYDVYKYSKENLDARLKEKYNSEILYNYLETRTEGNIMVFDENYLYYTLPEEEYIFIVQHIDKDGNKVELKMYEYLLTKDNKKDITSYLEKGVIPPKEYEINNIYNYVIEEDEATYKVVSKSTIHQ